MTTYPKVKRNVLLNPGPATTTDTVKYAQVVPDICPREKEFGDIMLQMQDDLVKVVHGDLKKYASVMFTGSGTVNIDATISSLCPPDKKILVLNNGAYSARGAEVCEYYHIDHINAKFDILEPLDPAKLDELLKANPDVGMVYCCHHETGTGVLNPIKELGAVAHKHGKFICVDTTSTYAMIPIDIEKDNLDFVMASAQKGLMSMTGLSYVVGDRKLIEASKAYPTRSYYCHLYTQYKFFNEKKEMHFTPPVQTVYATKQALIEYFQEGEQAKWARHKRVGEAILAGSKKLGFKHLIPEEKASYLVCSCVYPNDPNWEFMKVHDYLFERGFTIYPGKVSDTSTFRLCSLGTIDVPDINDFFVVLEEALRHFNIKVPVQY